MHVMLGREFNFKYITKYSKEGRNGPKTLKNRLIMNILANIDHLYHHCHIGITEQIIKNLLYKIFNSYYNIFKVRFKINAKNRYLIAASSHKKLFLNK